MYKSEVVTNREPCLDNRVRRYCVRLRCYAEDGSGQHTHRSDGCDLPQHRHLRHPRRIRTRRISNETLAALQSVLRNGPFDQEAIDRPIYALRP